MARPAAENGADADTSGPAPTGVATIELPVTARRGAGFVALRERTFRRFWIAAAVSNIGTWMQVLTVPFVVYDITGSRGWLSATIAAGYLPQFFVSPFAGAVADRLSRRVVLIGSLGVQLVMSVVLALMWSAGVHTVGLILAVVLVSNVFAGFQLICWQALVPSLVSRDALSSAVRLNSVQYMLGRAVGPAISGVVLGAYGPAAAFVINALTFLGVLAVLSQLRVAEDHIRGEATSVRRDLRDGLSFVRSHPVAAQAVLNAAVVAMFAYAVVQLAPTIAADTFRVGEGGYAALLVGHGAGSLTATAGLTVIGHRFRRSRVTISGLASAAVGTLLVGLTDLLPIGLVAFYVIGMAQSLVSVSQNTALQLQVDERFRGRVLSLYIMGNIGSVAVGGFVLAMVADAGGVAAAPIIGGIVIAGYTAFAVLTSNGMRGLDVDHPPT